MGLAMPNLNLMMSIGTFLLLIFWFFYPGVKAGMRVLKQNRVALLLIGLLFIHLIWLINTQNLDYAFKDIRIKAPLLVFGVVFGSVNFSKKQLKLFFLSLSLGVWVACLMAYYNYFKSDLGVLEYRDMVTGISHIRLSLLMVALAIGIINFWSAFSQKMKVYYALVFVNIFLFFQVIQSLTGTLTLGVILLLSFFVFLYQRWGKRAVWITGGTLIIAIIAGGILLISTYKSYFTPVEKIADLKSQTVNGNDYYHQKGVKLVENGHYIFMNICEPEMVSAWNRRSKVKLALKNGDQDLRDRLIRYLTSKGLKKDSLGVMRLTDGDIQNIQSGYPAEVYTRKSGLSLRIHSFLFAYHVYSKTGYASGYSFFQRMVYWQVALRIIKDNYLFGVGTGDVKDAFKDVYSEGYFDLDEKYWLRAHNQFLTFFVAFGAFGFAYFIYLFAESFRCNRLSYLASAVTLLALLSCLTEDTLETQAGVAFFGFFLALFSQNKQS